MRARRDQNQSRNAQACLRQTTNSNRTKIPDKTNAKMGVPYPLGGLPSPPGIECKTCASRRAILLLNLTGTKRVCLTEVRKQFGDSRGPGRSAWRLAAHLNGWKGRRGRSESEQRRAGFRIRNRRRRNRNLERGGGRPGHRCGRARGGLWGSGC